MFRKVLGLASFAALAFAPDALQPLFASEDAAGGLQQLHATDRQPVLIHDVSGGTLLGPVQSTVVVWSSGAVTYSGQEAFGDPVVGATSLSPAELDALMDGLAASGAQVLEDQWPQVSDVPLHTVTVLGPTSDSTAHTFSYWIGEGDYASVDEVLGRLMAEVQPMR